MASCVKNIQSKNY